MKWLLIVYSITSCLASNPGIRATINNSTLTHYMNQFTDEGLQLLVRNYGNYTYMLNYHDYHINISFTDIQISEIGYNPEHSRIQLEDPGFILLELYGTSIIVKSDYKFRVLLESKGELQVNVTETNLKLNLTVTASEKGNPQIVVNHAEFSIGSAKVTSDMDKTYNDLFQDAIDKELPWIGSEMPKLLNQNLPLLNGYLNSFNLTFLTVKDMYIDAHLTAEVDVTGDDTLSVPINGTFYSQKEMLEGEVVPTPISGDATSPIQLLITDYSLRSLLPLIWWDWSYTLSTLPPQFRFKMNTNYFALIIPQLRNHYGANKPVEIRVGPNRGMEVPTFNTSESGNLTAGVSLDIFCDPDGMGMQNALVVDITVNSIFDLTVSGPWLHADIDSIELISISVSKSEIGPIDAHSLRIFLQSGIQGFLPVLNEYADKLVTSTQHIGIPSMRFIKILDDSVELKDGYVQLGLDLDIVLSQIPDLSFY